MLDMPRGEVGVVPWEPASPEVIAAAQQAAQRKRTTGRQLVDLLAGENHHAVVAAARHISGYAHLRGHQSHVAGDAVLTMDREGMVEERSAPLIVRYRIDPSFAILPLNSLHRSFLLFERDF